MSPMARVKNFSLQTLKEFLTLYKEEYYNQNLQEIYPIIEAERKGYGKSIGFCRRGNLYRNDPKQRNL